MGLFYWFDNNCAWIYNNMNIFTWMFTDIEMSAPMCIIKCLVMSIWYMVIIFAPLIFFVRGFGYFIGGWTGCLNAYFVGDDD